MLTAQQENLRRLLLEHAQRVNAHFECKKIREAARKLSYMSLYSEPEKVLEAMTNVVEAIENRSLETRFVGHAHGYYNQFVELVPEVSLT